MLGFRLSLPLQYEPWGPQIALDCKGSENSKNCFLFPERDGTVHFHNVLQEKKHPLSRRKKRKIQCTQFTKIGFNIRTMIKIHNISDSNWYIVLFFNKRAYKTTTTPIQFPLQIYNCNFVAGHTINLNCSRSFFLDTKNLTSLIYQYIRTW